MTVIPHNKPSLGQEELNAAMDVLNSGMLAGGKQVTFFENEMCQFLGLPNGHAVATSTGSSALFLAIQQLNSKKVVMPSYVCQSLKQAAQLAQIKTEFIDIKKGSTTICQNSLSNSNADTLIYPYLYGEASKLPHFSGHIIEDIAQALGASYNNEKLGTIADIGVLSFYATKLITSGGQGGMIVSKNKEHINQIRHYLDFDMTTDDAAHFNFPMTEMQAAIGREQLKKLPSFIKKRAKIWQIYQQAGLPLLDVNSKMVNQNNRSNSHSVRYRAIVVTDKPESLIKYLANKNITAIVPIEDWELLSATENAINLANTTVSLPIYPELSLVQARAIALTCQEFFEHEE
ncbi:DegT/DnrJ/EryC1/StrS family aminotransferase [Colwelliaceae bacterium 6441]